MKTQTRLAIGISALLILACSPVVDVGDAEEAIRATATRWMELNEGRDAAGIAGLFSPEGSVYWEEREPAIGPAAIEAFMERTFSLDPGGEASFAPDRIQVAASGDLAVEHGGWQGPQGSGRYMTVHQKVDGEWRVAADMSLGQSPDGGAPEWARSLLAGWYEDFNARNAEALFDRYYAPDAKVGEAQGRVAVVALFEADWAESDRICTGSFTNFRVVGSVAAGWGVDECVEPNAEGAEGATTYSRWIGVYEQQSDGSWLTTRDIGEEVGG